MAVIKYYINSINTKNHKNIARAVPVTFSTMVHQYNIKYIGTRTILLNTYVRKHMILSKSDGGLDLQDTDLTKLQFLGFYY